MSVQQLRAGEITGQEKTARHTPAFFDPETLPWTPWVMEGTWFKLLSVDPLSGGFTMMLKVSPNNEAPIHGHIGAVEGIITKGGFGYDEDRGRAGHFVLEMGGINHKPDTDDDGMEMFAVIRGPLLGYHDDGSVALVLDGKKMYELAVAANCADHIEKPRDW